MRLGDQVTPLHYEATLTIDPNQESFDGEVIIRLRIRAATRFFWINATRLKLEHARVEIGDQTITAMAVPGNEDFIGLQFDRELPAGRAVLKIRYRGELARNDTRGLFKQQDGEHWYVMSQFEAINARRAFPCFDEPHWKTIWQLALKVKPEHSAVSNMPQLSEERTADGMKLVRFQPTPPLPSYLIALGVGPFDIVDGGNAGQKATPIRYITPKGRASEARYAKEITPRLLEILEDYFGGPYPFSKLDNLVLPVTVGFGAMENVGLITYSAGIILAKPEQESERFKQRYAHIAAHEIAHQWFGNLVTMRWWDDLWLNESFATWMSDKVVAQFNPAWQYHLQRSTGKQRAIDTDRLFSTRKIRQPVEKDDDLANAFDRITYEKGAAVLTMFENWLGEERFRKGVQRYLEKHQWSNATTQDFLQALADQEQALIPAFTSFIDQPGIPLLDVSLQCAGSAELSIKQQRFQPLKTAPDATQKWVFMACFRYGRGQQEEQSCTLVSEPSQSTTLAYCPDWLLANRAGVGYFIARLQGDLLARLKKVQLSPEEIIPLLNDANTLVQAGLLPANEALELAGRYAKHATPQVVQASLAIVRDLHPEWLDASGKMSLREWVQRRYGAAARTLGWRPKVNESEALRLLRAELLPLVADLGEDQDLRQQAQTLARTWLSNKQALPGLVPALLKTAALSGDRSLFNAYLQGARKSKDRRDRVDILGAMGFFLEAKLSQEAFALALTDSVPIHDAMEIFWEAAKDARLQPQVQRFLQSQYDALRKRLPQDYPARFPRMVDKLCNDKARASYESFFRERAEQERGGARNFAQTLERIDICRTAKQQQSKSLSKFFVTAN